MAALEPESISTADTKRKFLTYRDCKRPQALGRQPILPWLAVLKYACPEPSDMANTGRTVVTSRGALKTAKCSLSPSVHRGVRTAKLTVAGTA